MVTYRDIAQLLPWADREQELNAVAWEQRLPYTTAIGCLSYLVLPFLKQPTSIAHHVAAFWLIWLEWQRATLPISARWRSSTPHRDHMMTLTNPAAIALMRQDVAALAGCNGAGVAILVAFSASGDTSFCSAAQQRKCNPVNHFSLSSAVPQRPLKRRVPSITGSAQILDRDFWALEPNLSANRRPDQFRAPMNAASVRFRAPRARSSAAM